MGAGLAEIAADPAFGITVLILVITVVWSLKPDLINLELLLKGQSRCSMDTRPKREPTFRAVDRMGTACAQC